MADLVRVLKLVLTSVVDAVADWVKIRKNDDCFANERAAVAETAKAFSVILAFVSAADAVAVIGSDWVKVVKAIIVCPLPLL